MTQLEIFHATVKHTSPTTVFFFTPILPPDLARRLHEKYSLAPDADLRKYFGMYQPECVQP